MNMTFSYIMILIFILLLLVPVLVGIFVYRDASERGMNALLWTLVAVLVPGMLGLIVYLILRENQGDSLRCGKCQVPVQASFNICPHCGNELKGKCSSCGYPVESGYRNCPNCAAEIQNDGIQSAYAPRKERNGLLILVLVLVFLVPMLLFGGVFAARVAFNNAFQIEFSQNFDEILDGFEDELPTLSFAPIELDRFEYWRIREELQSLEKEPSQQVMVLEDAAKNTYYIALVTDGHYYYHSLEVENEKLTVHFHQRERYAQNNEETFYVIEVAQRFALEAVTVNDTPMSFDVRKME